MLATPVRRGRPPAPIICGRRHCSSCRRWRHVCDFTVDKWADLERSKPRTFRPSCRPCANQTRKERYYSKPLEERTERFRKLRERNRSLHPRSRPAAPPKPKPPDRADLLIRAMSKEDRHQYYMTGCLPLTDHWGATDEDHDPTPVPQGCPSCYLRGGVWCVTCPDSDVKAKARLARKEGRVIGNPMAIGPVRSS